MLSADSAALAFSRELYDSLADGDFEQLMETAVALNRGRSADPLESRYSPTTPSTDATSSSLERLD